MRLVFYLFRYYVVTNDYFVKKIHSFSEIIVVEFHV
jgi:hypothetical protein